MPDQQLRLTAMEWLNVQVELHGDVLPRPLLAQGFQWRGRRVPLVAPQGIFKPAVAELPLTITTTPKSPYTDMLGADGLLQYRYRGTNPNHHENVGLREVYRTQAPLIYFHGHVPGRYQAIYPVFVVGDEPDRLTFTVAVDEQMVLRAPEARIVAGEVERRRYATREATYRLHQRAFREKVVTAYHEQCCFCRLKHVELLDAAHIIPDRDPRGEPVVTNGLSLCKIHHAAFDRHFLGVRPDYRIEVRRDLLDEEDGPMLRHGLQGLHQSRIYVPRKRESKPDRDRLAERYELFRGSA